MDCQIHWMHDMSPAVNRGPWLLREDKAISLAASKVRYHTASTIHVVISLFVAHFCLSE